MLSWRAMILVGLPEPALGPHDHEQPPILILKPNSYFTHRFHASARKHFWVLEALA